MKQNGIKDINDEIYYDENYSVENSTDHRNKSSGTKAAYRYAKTKEACIINLFTKSSTDTLSR